MRPRGAATCDVARARFRGSGEFSGDCSTGGLLSRCTPRGHPRHSRSTNPRIYNRIIAITRKSARGTPLHARAERQRITHTSPSSAPSSASENPGSRVPPGTRINQPTNQTTNQPTNQPTNPSSPPAHRPTHTHTAPCAIAIFFFFLFFFPASLPPPSPLPPAPAAAAEEKNAATGEFKNRFLFFFLLSSFFWVSDGPKHRKRKTVKCVVYMGAACHLLCAGTHGGRGGGAMKNRPAPMMVNHESRKGS